MCVLNCYQQNSSCTHISADIFTLHLEACNVDCRHVNDVYQYVNQERLKSNITEIATFGEIQLTKGTPVPCFLIPNSPEGHVGISLNS